MLQPVPEKCGDGETFSGPFLSRSGAVPRMCGGDARRKTPGRNGDGGISRLDLLFGLLRPCIQMAEGFSCILRPLPLHPPLPECLSPVGDADYPVIGDVLCPRLCCYPESKRLDGNDVPSFCPAHVPRGAAVDVPDLGIGKRIPGVVEELEEDFPAPHHGCSPAGDRKILPSGPPAVRVAVSFDPSCFLILFPIVPSCTSSCSPQELWKKKWK